MTNDMQDNTSDDDDFTKPVRDAVYAGRALLDEGKTKEQAAQLVCELLSSFDQRTVSEAITLGAFVTWREAEGLWDK